MEIKLKLLKTSWGRVQSEKRVKILLQGGGWVVKKNLLRSAGKQAGKKKTFLAPS